MEFEWPFVPGLRLSEVFFTEGIRPILERHAPGLSCAVARIDNGSDVLGFDTPQSMDHGWGPRVLLFLAEEEYAGRAAELADLLARQLPLEVCGIPTHFVSPRLIDAGLERVDRGPVQHGVVITTVKRFFCEYLGFDPGEGIGLMDWLTAPGQRLRTIAAGRVFWDPDGELTRRRELLQWYPRDLWLYLMASQWYRIGQEEAFVGRAGEVGDELGSQVIATRLVLELMRLAFLQERQHAPYMKWFGSAFAQLHSASALGPLLKAAAQGVDWKTREGHLSAAYSILAARHNALGLTPVLDTQVRPFHQRPFLVIDADRFAEALVAQIGDQAVRALPKGVGAVWQFADSTDVLDEVERCMALGAVYGGLAGVGAMDGR